MTKNIQQATPTPKVIVIPAWKVAAYFATLAVAAAGLGYNVASRAIE